MRELEKKPRIEKIKDMIALVLCLILVLLYCKIMVWGEKPEVPLEYEMYYITHELTDWPGYGDLEYDSGSEEYCTNIRRWKGSLIPHKICARKGTGWDLEQYNGSTNDNTTSHMYYIPKTAGSSADFKFQINEFEGNGKVKVYANDVYSGDFSGTGDKTVTIPGFEEKELLKITFVAEDCKFTVFKAALEW